MSIRERMIEPLYAGVSGISLWGEGFYDFSEMEIAKKAGFANQWMREFLHWCPRRDLHERAMRLLEACFCGKGGRLMYFKNREIDHFKTNMRRLPSIRIYKRSRAERIWEDDHSKIYRTNALDFKQKEEWVYPYQPLHTNTRGGECGLKMKD